MMVVVLNHGSEKDRQMAVYVPRDESGYTDMGCDLPDKEVWRPFLMQSLDDGGMATIFEKGPPR
jgi:hypothetical protein